MLDIEHFLGRYDEEYLHQTWPGWLWGSMHHHADSGTG